MCMCVCRSFASVNEKHKFRLTFTHFQKKYTLLTFIAVISPFGCHKISVCYLDYLLLFVSLLLLQLTIAR